MTLRRAVACLTLGAACAVLSGAGTLGTPAPLDERARQLATVDGAVFELAEGWYARLETTEGAILVRLHPEQAPQSVAHFAAFAEGRLPWIDPTTGDTVSGHHYDGVRVHKSRAGRQFEVGVPSTEGGQPPDMFISPAEANQRINFSQPFKIGMTRAPLGRISASVFFVTASALPYLNGRHPCFGTVIHGRETVRAITDVPTYSNGRPIDEIRLKWVRVFAAGDPDPLPDPVPYVPSTPKIQMRPEPPPARR